MLQNNPELKSKIDQLWNKFWAGGISNPLTAIEQITYLLFMKRLDELDQKKQADAEWTGEPYAASFCSLIFSPFLTFDFLIFSYLSFFCDCNILHFYEPSSI